MFAREHRPTKATAPKMHRRADVTANLYSAPVLLRKPCPCGGGCPSCADRESRLVKENARSQAHSEDANAGTAAPQIVHQVLRSAGQPLDSMTRTKMEGRLSHDFSAVQLHTAAHAGESGRAVHALAYIGGDP